MEPQYIALALVALVIVLLILRRIVRSRTNQWIANQPQKIADRLQSDASALGTGLSFADPIAGRSLIARALEGPRLAASTGENRWLIGLEDVAAIHLEWVVEGARGVLRPTRARAIGESLASAGNWSRVLVKLEAAAAREGAEFSRVESGPFVDSGERVKGDQIWVRAGV